MQTLAYSMLAIGTPYIPGWAELRPFIVEIWLIATIVAVLLAPFFTTTSRSNAICALVALAGITLAFISQIVVGTGAGVVGEHFRGLLVADQFGWLWKLLLLLFVAGVILMWFTTTAASMHEGDGPEFFALLLSATLGMSLMASTGNLLMLVIAVEMASLPSYVLAGFRKTHRIGAEASLKYVLFGAATSAVMIYGLSLFYGLYGTLQVSQLGVFMSKTDVAHAGVGTYALLAVAVSGLIVGLGFKVSAVPFHFWCPDVFEGANIEVTTFLSVASKGGALVLFLRVLTLIAAGLGFKAHAGISLAGIAIAIGVIGSITATVGNMGALVQNNIKRLLAYSSIAHAGYMLCALSLLINNNQPVAQPAPGTILSSNAAQAILLYLAVYMFMNLGAFTVAALIYRQTGSEDIRDYAALGRRAPIAALCLSACLFSLIGLPPFAGFVAKFNLMSVLGVNGGWWWALVAVIGVNTIVSLYYYVRVIKIMYFSPSDAPAVAVNPLGLGLAIACAAMLLAMFVGLNPLNNWTKENAQIFQPKSSPAVAQTAMITQQN